MVHPQSRSHAGRPAAPGHDTFVSLVVPVLNETASIRPFLSAVVPILKDVAAQPDVLGGYEVIFVDDGSTDDTAAEILRARSKDASIKLLSLSRNFGKDIALAAGLDFADGRAVVPMDVDLQDPPNLLPQMVDKWLEGYDVVYGVRADRNSDSRLKRVTANAFYALYNKMSHTRIPANAGDYRLLDRKVVAVIKQLPERIRFMKGLYAWVGFRQTSVTFTREMRAVGETKWSFWRLWNFAIDGITASTTVPLRIWTYLGASISLLAFLYAGFLILDVFLHGTDVPGYASIMVVMLFFGGLNLVTLGILGEYIGRIFTEVKGRPLYVLADKIGFEEPAPMDQESDEPTWIAAPISS
jgi:glycosyltransferase involved in cell wall biosynthesis